MMYPYLYIQYESDTKIKNNRFLLNIFPPHSRRIIWKNKKKQRDKINIHIGKWKKKKEKNRPHPRKIREK